MAYLGLCGMLATWNVAFMGWREKKGEETTGGARPKHARIHVSTGKRSCRRTEGKVSSQAWVFFSS